MDRGEGMKLTSSSYPTYEEWKLYIQVAQALRKLGSYPTYEEWKLYTISSKSIPDKVLILPMRNGNFNNSSISCSFFSFLSYL